MSTRKLWWNDEPHNYTKRDAGHALLVAKLRKKRPEVEPIAATLSKHEHGVAFDVLEISEDGRSAKVETITLKRGGDALVEKE